MAGGEDESESVGVRLVLFGPVPSDVPRSEVQMLNEDLIPSIAYGSLELHRFQNTWRVGGACTGCTVLFCLVLELMGDYLCLYVSYLGSRFDVRRGAEHGVRVGVGLLWLML